MNLDISELLNHWDPRPGQIVARRFVGKDGSEKIQMRLDLGILQMNAVGRPDGKRPLGCESWFEHYTRKLEQHRKAHAGNDDDFVLGAEECLKLQLEALQYHHRYICLLELEDFEAVFQDTQRNLEVFDFVQEFAETPELAWSLQQFRPQLLMMRTRAQVMYALKTQNHTEGMQLLDEGLERLREFFRSQDRQDLLEASGELRSLETWRDQLHEKRPLSKREKLELALSEAVQREDYEQAAHFRDQLRKLQSQD